MPPPFLFHRCELGEGFEMQAISRSIVLGLGICACVMPQASAAQARQGQVGVVQPVTGAEIPSSVGMLLMIRSTIEAVNQANQTANYSVLYLMGSDSFRRSNPPEVLAQVFSQLRMTRANLSPALALSPQLNRPARFENGALRLEGFIPSQPNRILFDLSFVPVQGTWQISSVQVQLARASTPASVQAPAAKVPASPARGPASSSQRQGGPARNAPAKPNTQRPARETPTGR